MGGYMHRLYASTVPFYIRDWSISRLWYLQGVLGPHSLPWGHHRTTVSRSWCLARFTEPLTVSGGLGFDLGSIEFHTHTLPIIPTALPQQGIWEVFRREGFPASNTTQPIHNKTFRLDKRLLEVLL